MKFKDIFARHKDKSRSAGGAVGQTAVGDMTSQNYDPLGMYTGAPSVAETPEQDADDL
ncbi:MAG: hypothetical protein LBQ40_07905 [Clostridiales bacterium]|jgi:hypothetical protein|nr:hypothetical protein [Clostridiales bacterium]